MTCRILGYSAFCCSCCPGKLLRRGLYFLHVGSRLKVSGMDGAQQFCFSHCYCLRRCFKEDFLLSPDKYSCGAKPSWIKKNMPGKFALLSDVCWVVLLEQHVQELFSGCSECPALFANPESSRKHLGINRCYVELPLKIPVKEWMCWTTSTKISL